MKKIAIFGNSGAGKSTLAKQLAESNGLKSFDLDTVAWQPSVPPQRMPLEDSRAEIDRFMSLNESWVIEGCYSDLLELVLPQSNQLIYLNLPIEVCIANAKKRPWEAHKYESKEAQDANLNMLTDWIAQYVQRDDTFSQSSHEKLFEAYSGKKIMLTSNEASRNIFN